jgi:hypothetical protein
MIHIHRTPAPQHFLGLPVRTTQLAEIRRWLLEPDRHALPKAISRTHQLPALEAAVAAEFRHKCMVCERKLLPDQGRVGYFRPLAGALPSGGGPLPDHAYYFWLLWDWSNLTYICRQCLDHQVGHFPVSNSRVLLAAEHLERENARPYFLAECPLLLDPSVEAPAGHLEFDERGGVAALGDSGFGQQTLDQFKLNRSSLRTARMETALELKNQWLQAYEATLDQQTSRLLRLQADLLAACGDAEPFAGMKRQLLLKWVHDKRKAAETPEALVKALGQASWQETVNQLEQMTYPIDALLRVDRSATFAIRALTRLYGANGAPAPAARQVTIILGDVVQGDKVEGDQIVVGNIEGSQVVLGRHARLNLPPS